MPLFAIVPWAQTQPRWADPAPFIDAGRIYRLEPFAHCIRIISENLFQFGTVIITIVLGGIIVLIDLTLFITPFPRHWGMPN